MVTGRPPRTSPSSSSTPATACSSRPTGTPRSPRCCGVRTSSLAVNKMDLVDSARGRHRPVAADVHAIATAARHPRRHRDPGVGAGRRQRRGPLRRHALVRRTDAARTPRDRARPPRPGARVGPAAHPVRHPPQAARSPSTPTTAGTPASSPPARARRRRGRVLPSGRAAPWPASTCGDIAQGRRRAASVVDPAHRRRRHRRRPDRRGDDPVPLRRRSPPSRAGSVTALRQEPGCSSSTGRARCSPWSARSTAGSTSTPCGWRPRTSSGSTTSAGHGALRVAAARRVVFDVPPRGPSSSRPRRRSHPRRRHGRRHGSRRAPAVTLPVGLDLTGRQAFVVGGAPALGRGARALVDARALVGGLPMAVRGTSRS